MNQTLSFGFELKSVQEDGSFEGLLSVYGNVDLGGDVVKRGAFTKTIKESGGEVPLLWQHDTKQPIGMLSLSDSEDALMVKGRILRELKQGNEAHVLLKAGVLKGLSIGFEAVKKSFKDGVRYLEEIKLLEGSVVTFNMNQLAVVTSVKSIDSIRSFESWLHQEGGFSRAQSKALASRGWTGLATAEQDAEEAAVLDYLRTANAPAPPRWMT